MRKLLVPVVAVFALLMAATPGGAVTYGELDAGEHPYVGFAIFFVPSEPGWFSCSGTLLDANTFLTAGHCVFDVGTNGAETPGEATSGGNDIWVTFDDTDVLAGWPLRADIPDEAQLYAARSAWLNDPAHGFTKGIAIHHPDYDDFASFPVTNDVGVVQLDHDVDMPAATRAAVEAGVWLRPFRDLIYTMPPYVCDTADVERITNGILAAARVA